MNAENDNFNTPKQTKRLGLRRSSSVLKKSATNSAGPSAKFTKLEIETPISTPKTKLHGSDAKISYKDLEQNQCNKSNESASATPKNSNPMDLQRLAVSSNCRPYRLALNKKIREKMTKKRLEFYLANETEKEDTEEKQVEIIQQLDSESNNALNLRKELLEKIESAQKELILREEHLKKVEELQKAINIWKSGLSSALLDLQQKIEPRMDIADLVERLNIPQEMIKYVND